MNAGRPLFIFAGGGTGGHLYPGLAIAEQLAMLRPDAGVHFIASNRAIDRTVLNPEGVAYTALPAQPLGLTPRALWRFARNWPASVRATRSLIKTSRSSGAGVHLVAMGGFVAAPAVQAARVERVPITLVNLDAAPGKANRWIARHANAGSFTTVADAAHPSWHLVAPIVRKAAIAQRDKAACRRELGLDPDRPVLMITGGSQGASSINRLMAAFVREHADHLKRARWQVLHQTGSGEDTSLSTVYQSAGIDALVVPFTRQMGTWWGAADFALSRAGAGAVAEAWCNRVPTLFMPYPYHTDNHQALNAAELVRRHAAMVVNDEIDPALNMAPKAAGGKLGELLQNPEVLGPFRHAASVLPPANGAEEIAKSLAESLSAAVN